MAVEHFNGTVVKSKNAEPEVLILSDEVDDASETLLVTVDTREQEIQE